ncbi:MAG: MBL fold metallo-hydrolase [Planctomycetes bacterium]|nr:MBL fold metallo-hydrolase [Planctomycetota bacterium]
MRELVILGSGTGIPTARRGPAGYVLGLDGDVTLIDPGPGSLKRACDAGFPVEGIARVLLTHHHPDHCLDLAALLFARRNALLDERCGALEVIGGPGTADLLAGFQRVFGAWVTLPADRLRVSEIGPGPFRLCGAAAVTAFAMKHDRASLGYRFELTGGVVLALSGDTDECAGALALGAGADHYVLEASLPDSMYAAGHLTPERAARLAAQCGCRHLILTHFYPPVDVDEARRAAQALFRGRVTIAEDGMRIGLGAAEEP